MTPQQIIAAQTVALAVLDTIAEQDSLGAPSGPIYAALMTAGCTLQQYQSLTSSMVRNGLVTADEDKDGTPIVFFITEAGQAMRRKIKAKLDAVSAVPA